MISMRQILYVVEVAPLLNPHHRFTVDQSTYLCAINESHYLSGFHQELATELCSLHVVTPFKDRFNCIPEAHKNK